MQKTLFMGILARGNIELSIEMDAKYIFFGEGLVERLSNLTAMSGDGKGSNITHRRFFEDDKLAPNNETLSHGSFNEFSLILFVK